MYVGCFVDVSRVCLWNDARGIDCDRVRQEREKSEDVEGL